MEKWKGRIGINIKKRDLEIFSVIGHNFLFIGKVSSELWYCSVVSVNTDVPVKTFVSTNQSKPHHNPKTNDWIRTAVKTSNLTLLYILLLNKHQFVCEGLPHYWPAERFWFFTQVGHVCAWINITSTEADLLVDRATSWICRFSLACSGWRKGRWVHCGILIWCTAVTHIKIVLLYEQPFFYTIWCSTVWDFTLSSSVYFHCHSYQLQINLCKNIKVSFLYIHY